MRCNNKKDVLQLNIAKKLIKNNAPYLLVNINNKKSHQTIFFQVILEKVNHFFLLKH